MHVVTDNYSFDIVIDFAVWEISLLLCLVIFFSLQLLRELTKLMHECWNFTNTARPTAFYLKKKISKLSQEFS